MKVMKAAEKPLSPKEVAARIKGSSHAYIRQRMPLLANRGLLTKLVGPGGQGTGEYDLPENVETEKPFEASAEGKRVQSDSLALVPLMSIRTEAGSGEGPLQEEIAGYIAYDRTQIQRDTGVDPRQLAVLPVAGNSMEPTLKAGDRIVVARYAGEPLMDGAIYVFRSPHRGAIVKRIFWLDSDTVQLRSDNDNGPEMTIKPGHNGDEWEVVGRVVKVEKAL